MVLPVGRELELPVTRWDWGPGDGAVSASWTAGDRMVVFDAQLRLAVGGALQARIEHVSRDKVRAFAALGPDVNAWTLNALAPLTGPDHRGRLGQAFEYQAAELVNGGDPSTLRVISRALELLNVDVEEQPRMVVCGLEKARDGSIERLLERLPEDAVLRDGSRGRPRSAAAALAELKATTWTQMSDAEAASAARGGTGRAEVNQLGRADAFVSSGRAVVPISLKINSGHVDKAGWAGVPLWLTSEGSGSRFRRLHSADAPTVVATLLQNHEQIRADRLLDEVLSLGRGAQSRGDLPRGRRGAYKRPVMTAGRETDGNPDQAPSDTAVAIPASPPSWPLSHQMERQLVADLYLRRGDSFGAVLHYLREPTAILNNFGATVPRTTVRLGRLRVVDDATSVRSWQDAAAAGHLITADGTVVRNSLIRYAPFRRVRWRLLSR